MSYATWSLIKQSKRFYVNTYRRAAILLFFSLIVNLCLGLAMYYVQTHRPIPDFYATSGILPPVELKGLDAPNYSSVPLLATEPPKDNDIKVIPQ